MCLNYVNGINPGRKLKLTDKHAAEISNIACFGINKSVCNVNIGHTTL